MCIACVEFIKNTLNVKEFKSALQEISRTDEEHLYEIEKILRTGTQDEDDVRKKIADLKK